MARKFAVRSSNVVSETIDGELIILDLAAGTYHAAQGVGAALWQLAVAGLDEGQIMTACQDAWPGTPVADEVRAFLDHVVGLGLLSTGDSVPTSARRADFVHLDRIDWSHPTLTSCDDLADMIQLDPIHDVTDTGWPTARSVG